MPEGMPSVRIYFVLSEDGQRQALAHGQHPKAVQALEVKPDSPHWAAVLDLHPFVTPAGDAYVIVGHQVTTMIRDDSPSPGRSDAVWPRPRLDVWTTPSTHADLVADAVIECLDAWPAVGDLVSIQREHLKSVGRQVEAAKARHEALISEWVDWWQARVKLWGLQLRDALQEQQIPSDWSLLKQVKQLIAGLEGDWWAKGRFDRREDDEANAAFENVSAAVRDALSRIEEAGRRLRQTQHDGRQRQAREDALAEAGRWIEAHGSTRLRRILAEDLLRRSLNVYRDERLHAERPGWMWLDKRVKVHDPVAPPEESFETLDRAREVADRAKLAHVTYWATRLEDWDRQSEQVSEWVATDEFLGRPIVFGSERLNHVCSPPKPPAGYDPSEEPF